MLYPLRQLCLRMCLYIASALLLTITAHAAETPPVDTGQVVGQMVSSHDVVTPGQEFYVALSTVIDEHWHTYWANPGDSGEPVDIMFELPESLSSGEVVWPLPKPVPTGPIVNYGFEDNPLFPIAFKVSEDAQIGETLEIKGLAYYLVCYDVCIPEDFEFSLPVRVGEVAVEDGRWSSNIRRALAEAPMSSDMMASARVDAGQLVIDAALTGDVSNPYIYPFDSTVISHSEPQAALVGTEGVRVIATKNFGIKDAVTKPLQILLGYDETVDSVTRPRGVIITAAPGEALPIGVTASASAAAGVANVSGDGPDGTSMTIFTALIGAFLGGLVLNLMPCVFPVISMKALSFARHAHDERSAIRRQGWLYTIGVIVTFMALTAVLLILKAAGSQIGWGFQLQSPWVTGLLALLVFTIGLNLIGAFEFGSSLQGVGGNLAAKEGAAGSFFTGALAVVVATPCTAPFMAGAVGFALAQPAIVTIIVFMALAIGFALPFLALAYMPGLLAKLPKPGAWMERFKEILAFPMFGAAIWLVWVLNFQGGAEGLLKILIAMLLVGFAIWLVARGKVWKWAGALAVLIALYIPFSIATVSAGNTITSDASLPKEAWSEAHVEALRAQGRPVFVDFTAAWCVTCKVNELGALSDSKVKQAFVDTNTAFLIADWTNRNDEIARELEKYGRSGVPLYLYFSPDNNTMKGEILPQVLTVNMLLKTLEGA